LPEDAAFALTTDVDPAADGCLIWRAGQREPCAITPPGSSGARLSGAFVLLVPEQPSDGGQVFEDGFGMFLSKRSAAALRDALSSGEPLSVQGSFGTMSLSLEWIQMTYENPIDGSVAHAEGGFHLYRPTGAAAGARSDPRAVRLKQVILLTSEADVAARIEVKALSAYCGSLGDLAAAVLEPYARGASWELLLDVSLDPGGAARYRMASRGEGGNDTACQTLHSKLPGVVAPPVRSGPVTFQLLFEMG
jgi:hypothetical protein